LKEIFEEKKGSGITKSAKVADPLSNIESPEKAENLNKKSFFVEYNQEKHMIEGTFSTMDSLEEKIKKDLSIIPSITIEMFSEIHKEYLIIHGVDSLSDNARLRVRKNVAQGISGSFNFSAF